MTDLSSLKKNLKIWRTITVGKNEPYYSSGKKVRKALYKAGMIDDIETDNQYDYSTGARMNEVTFIAEHLIQFNSEEREVKLVKLDAKSLGLTDHINYGYGGENYQTIMEIIQKLGLKPCPVEVPWRLTLEFKDHESARNVKFSPYPGDDPELPGKLVFFTRPLPFRDSLLVLCKGFVSLFDENQRTIGDRCRLRFQYCLYGGVPIFHHHGGQSWIFEMP